MGRIFCTVLILEKESSSTYKDTQTDRQTDTYTRIELFALSYLEAKTPALFSSRPRRHKSTAMSTGKREASSHCSTELTLYASQNRPTDLPWTHAAGHAPELFPARRRRLLHNLWVQRLVGCLSCPKAGTHADTRHHSRQQPYAARGRDGRLVSIQEGTTPKQRRMLMLAGLAHLSDTRARSGRRGYQKTPAMR